MARFRGYEISIGFLAATALWAVFFVLQPMLFLSGSNEIVVSHAQADGPRENSEHTEFLGVNLGEWLLFFATVGLVVATRQLVKSADQTAKRQLRAYVYLENAKFVVSGAACKITLRVKNYGQTPAHNVVLDNLSVCVPWNGGNTVLPTSTRRTQLGSMAPNGDFVDNEDIVDKIDVTDLRNGNTAVYLVGTIAYDTVFRMRRRVTNFRYYVGGDMGLDGNEMYADDMGNDAT